MLFETIFSRAGRGMPEMDSFIVTGRGETSAVARPHDAGRARAMFFICRAMLPVLRIPQPYRLIIAGGREYFTVR